ncbi:hypothetical protein ACQPZJ_05110 [Actinoplanes sp. CA-054009]
MTDSVSPELRGVGLWLRGHGLAEARPTPLLAARLKARWLARLVAAVLLALLVIAVALTYSAHKGAESRAPLAVLTAAVVALVAGQALLDRWVRRVDRRAGAGLVRRVARPVPLGWRTVLGLPRAAFAVVTFAGAAALGIGALAVGDTTGRYAAAVLLIGLCGVALVGVVQLRQLLTCPAVADDEDSLTADAVMRVEDAREAVVPTVLWCLPGASLLDAVPGWWTAAWLGFVLVGLVALVLINLRTASSGSVARHAMGG